MEVTGAVVITSRSGKFPPSRQRDAFRIAVTPAPFLRGANHCYSRLHRKLDYGVRGRSSYRALTPSSSVVDVDDDAVLCFLAKTEHFSRVLVVHPRASFRPYLARNPRQIAIHASARVRVQRAPPSPAYRCIPSDATTERNAALKPEISSAGNASYLRLPGSNCGCTCTLAISIERFFIYRIDF